METALRCITVSQVCTSTDLLFPFTPVVETCSSCQAVYHRFLTKLFYADLHNWIPL